MEVCPKCATPSYSTYDHRWVHIKDAPIRRDLIVLKIKKRRFWCKPCQKPFTEPISGIRKGYRTTERYRRHVTYCCEKYTDLKSVKHHAKCSYSSLYKIYYEQLELKVKSKRYPWPKNIGIDEHKFKKHPKYGFPIFATNIVDHNNKRIFELTEGRSVVELKESLKHIPGRENVRSVTMDLSQPYRTFIKDFFPKATVIADKFHVVRLLHPAIRKYRINITGDKRKLKIRTLLLKNGSDLEFTTRKLMHRWLEENPTLKEVYFAKEAVHKLYRTKGYKRALRAFNNLCDQLGHSKIKELKTFRQTLIKWKWEILAYFKIRRTNGRTEGFNGKAKLIKRRAYGYRSFKNYRLRVLNACA